MNSEYRAALKQACKDAGITEPYKPTNIDFSLAYEYGRLPIGVCAGRLVWDTRETFDSGYAASEFVKFDREVEREDTVKELLETLEYHVSMMSYCTDTLDMQSKDLARAERTLHYLGDESNQWDRVFQACERMVSIFNQWGERRLAKETKGMTNER